MGSDLICCQLSKVDETTMNVFWFFLSYDCHDKVTSRPKMEYGCVISVFPKKGRLCATKS